MQLDFLILPYMNDTILKRVEHKLLLALPPKKAYWLSDKSKTSIFSYGLIDWLIALSVYGKKFLQHNLQVEHLILLSQTN